MQDPKIHHLGTIVQLCRAISLATKARKKLVEQQYLLHMSSQYGELRPNRAEIILLVWGTPANFNGFRVLVSLRQRRHLVEATQTLHDVWPFGLVHYIHFRGFLPCNGILPGTTFTLRPSLAVSYFGSVTARHSSTGREPNFAALNRERHLYSAGWPSR